MTDDVSYIVFSAILSMSGIFLIVLSLIRWRDVECTTSNGYDYVEMKVLDINLVPNNLSGEAMVGPISEEASIVIVRYQYLYNNKIYESRGIFPLEIEWMKPRVSPFSLFEDLKSQRLNKCFVDKYQPGKAILFRGWSPYLKRHVAGVFGSGVLVAVVGIFFVAHFLGFF